MARGDIRIRRWPITDDRPTPAVALPVDEFYWTRPVTALPGPRIRVWAEDDPVVPQIIAGSVPVAAGPPPSQRLRSERRFQRWPSYDERPTPAGSSIVDDTPGPTLGMSKDSATFIVWVGQDEIVPQPPLTPEEHYWLRLYSVPVNPAVRLWHQQDEVPLAAISLPVDEFQWQRPVVWPPAAVRAPFMANDEMVLPAPLGVDEVYWQRPYSVPVFPARPAATADDEIVPQPPLVPREDFWLQLFSVTVAPLVRLWHQQDEVPTEPPPATYTADSRERIGKKRERVEPKRIGPWWH